jgi:hypothetical protein
MMVWSAAPKAGPNLWAIHSSTPNSLFVMRNTLLILHFVAYLLAAHAATNGLRSHLLIDAGQQFVLGGDQVGPFRVSARNSGRVPVLFPERTGQHPAVEQGRLEPRQLGQLSLAAGAAVPVRNLGRERAELDVDVQEPCNCRMTYEPAAANQKIT